MWHIMTDSPDDFLRWFNLALAAATLVCAVPAIPEWFSRPRAEIMTQLAILVFVVSTAIGTLESLVDETPSPGIRLYVATLALGWSLAAVVFEQRDRKKD